jgi:hypothetical protein
MVETQEILAVDEVKREIRRKDDDVAKWVLVAARALCSA